MIKVFMVFSSTMIGLLSTRNIFLLFMIRWWVFLELLSILMVSEWLLGAEFCITLAILRTVEEEAELAFGEAAGTSDKTTAGAG